MLLTWKVLQKSIQCCLSCLRPRPDNTNSSNFWPALCRLNVPEELPLNRHLKHVVLCLFWPRWYFLEIQEDFNIHFRLLSHGNSACSGNDLFKVSFSRENLSRHEIFTAIWLFGEWMFCVHTYLLITDKIVTSGNVHSWNECIGTIEKSLGRG